VPHACITPFGLKGDMLTAAGTGIAQTATLNSFLSSSFFRPRAVEQGF
jgi:hypothetical protein